MFRTLVDDDQVTVIEMENAYDINIVSTESLDRTLEYFLHKMVEELHKKYPGFQISTLHDKGFYQVEFSDDIETFTRTMKIRIHARRKKSDAQREIDELKNDDTLLHKE